jgi:hypothetical protein
MIYGDKHLLSLLRNPQKLHTPTGYQLPATRGRVTEFENKTKRHSRKLDCASVLTSMHVAR